MAAGDVFISYRRVDTRWPAAALYDRLAARLGAERVFKDIDDIEPGDDFVRTLDEAVSGADVVLVLMGDRWLDAADEHGNRRLDDPSDFVRIEIATALRRGIRVVPVLVDDALMPRGSQLPPELAPLARMQAIQISAERMDVSRLMRVIEPILERADRADRAGPRGADPHPALVDTSEPGATDPRAGLSAQPAAEDPPVPPAPVQPGSEPPPQAPPRTTASPAPSRGALSGRPRGNRRVLLIAGVAVVALASVVAIVLSQQRRPEIIVGDPRPPGLDYAVAVDGTGHRGYVATDDGIQVFDTASREQLTTIMVGSADSRFALTDDGRTLYVTDPQGGALHVVDTQTGSVTDRVRVETGVLGIALDQEAGLAYLASANGNSVLAIELATGQTRHSIELTDAPVDLALVPAVGRLYATSMWSDTVLAVDTRLRQQLTTIEVGRYPRGLAVDELTQTLYVSHLARPDGITVIDTAGNQVADTIPLSDPAQGIVIDPIQRRLYAALETGGVAVVDLAANALVGTLDLTGDLQGIGVDPGPDPDPDAGGESVADPTLVVSRRGAPALVIPWSAAASGSAADPSSTPPSTTGGR